MMKIPSILNQLIYDRLFQRDFNSAWTSPCMIIVFVIHKKTHMVLDYQVKARRRLVNKSVRK